MSLPTNVSETRRTAQQPCIPGCWCSAGIAIACPADHYSDMFLAPANRTDQLSCTPCPVNSHSPLGSPDVTQCTCDPAYYVGTDDDMVHADGDCVRCPQAPECAKVYARGFITTLRFLPVAEGYYRLNPSSNDVRRCPDAHKESESACVGAAGGIPSHVARRRLQVGPGGVTAGDALCRSGLQGAFCRTCEDEGGRYFDADASECLSCESSGTGASIGGTVAAVVGFALLVRALPLLRRFPSVRTFVRRRLPPKSKAMSIMYSLLIKAKITFSFYQIASQVPPARVEPAAS